MTHEMSSFPSSIVMFERPSHIEKIEDLRLTTGRRRGGQLTTKTGRLIPVMKTSEARESPTNNFQRGVNLRTNQRARSTKNQDACNIP
jgi:hypothetical protein